MHLFLTPGPFRYNTSMKEEEGILHSMNNLVTHICLWQNISMMQENKNHYCRLVFKALRFPFNSLKETKREV